MGAHPSTVMPEQGRLFLGAGQGNPQVIVVVEMAQRQGFFKAAGLTIEILYTEGGASTLTPVIAGSMDIAMSNGIRIGVVAPRVAARLLKLIANGNRYAAGVTSLGAMMGLRFRLGSTPTAP